MTTCLKCEATIKTYCEETSRLNIETNKLKTMLDQSDEKLIKLELRIAYLNAHIVSLEAKLKEKDEQIAKMKELFKTKGYLDQVWKQNEEIDHLKERLSFPCTSCEELKPKISKLRKAIEPFAGLGKYQLRTDWINAKRAYEESA